MGSKQSIVSAVGPGHLDVETGLGVHLAGHVADDHPLGVPADFGHFFTVVQTQLV